MINAFYFDKNVTSLFLVIEYYSTLVNCFLSDKSEKKIFKFESSSDDSDNEINENTTEDVRQNGTVKKQGDCKCQF